MKFSEVLLMLSDLYLIRMRPDYYFPTWNVKSALNFNHFQHWLAPPNMPMSKLYVFKLADIASLNGFTKVIISIAMVA